MVKQHLYRIDRTGGRTIAVSAAMKDSAWLSLLEQQLALTDLSSLPAPACFLYPLGRGLVFSRCAVNPYTPEPSIIAHQLVFDETGDIDALPAVLPLAANLLPVGLFGLTASPDPLPPLAAQSLGSPDELDRCFETFDRFFAGDEMLLARFLSALSLCARDKRYCIRALIEDAPEAVSEAGRRLMELALRCLSRDDILRLSLSTLQLPGSMTGQYTVCFTPHSGQGAVAAPNEILLNLTARSITVPPDAVLPSADQYLSLARALLRHDAGNAVYARREAASSPANALRLEIPPFEKGMSLKQYFSDWQSALDERRPLLTEEAFRSFASGEWPKILSGIVTASELMENMAFLTELNGVLSRIRREKLETALALTDDTLTDMIVLLLDSIRWQQVDLSLPQTARLMRSVTAYSQVLTGDQCTPECLAACRVIYRLLTSSAAIHDSLADLDLLEELSPSLFEALQDCLKQYVENRLADDMDVIDEQLAFAAMLGFAKFTDGVPDLRLADKLVERIEEQSGHKAARRFEAMLDRVRRHLHSTRGGLMRRRDMKLFLFISLLLLALIAGISLWFLFFS